MNHLKQVTTAEPDQRSNKPPLDANLRFLPNAGSTKTRSREHIRFGSIVVVQYELKFILLRTLRED